MDGLTRKSLLLGAATLASAPLSAGEPVQAQNLTPSPTPPGRVVAETLRGGILLIGFERPEAENHIDAAIMRGIGQALYRLEHDDGLRVGVLYGRGPDFTPGIDVEGFAAAFRSGELPIKDPDFIPPTNIPPQRTKPLVTAVHGRAYYIGHELCLASDVRVAASNTRFLQAEVTHGLFPAGGATVRFTREAGWGNAMRYMLTGDGWDAREAYRMGLVQAVTAPGKELETALALATKIAAATPIGVRTTLASANQGLAENERTAFAALPAQFRRLLSL
jgi:enoyl-CoA hydratase